MSGAWIAVLVLGASAVGIAKLAMGGMIREEAQTRLGRIPYALVRLASARVAHELRDDLAAEWRAELQFVLTGTEGMPLTRLARGIRYSAGLLVSARAITDGLTRGASSRAMRWVPLLDVAAHALLLLIFFSGLTNVNWASPLSPALVFAVLLAAQVTGISFVFFQFTGDRLQQYKDDTGVVPLRGLDEVTKVSTGLALGFMIALATLIFSRMRAEVLNALGPHAGATAIIISLTVALVSILGNALLIAAHALGSSGKIRPEPPSPMPDGPVDGASSL